MVVDSPPGMASASTALDLGGEPDRDGVRAAAAERGEVLTDIALEGKDTDGADRQLSQRAWRPRSARGSSSVMSTRRVYPVRRAVTPAYQPRVESSSSRGMPATSRPRMAGPSPALTSAITSGLSKYVVAATIAFA